MQQRRLGENGPLVSAIGIGAMSFAGSYGPTTEDEAHKLTCRNVGVAGAIRGIRGMPA